MPRAKRGVKARRRRNKIMKAAKGFVGGKRRLFSSAVETVRRAWRYAYRDRRNKKREFRRLWIIRINAAARECETTYARLMGWMKKADVELDRKILSDLAVHDIDSFRKIVDAVRPA